MLQSLRLFKLICIGLAILALSSTSPALGVTVTVTNLNDSGPGSLRDAIFTASPRRHHRLRLGSNGHDYADQQIPGD